MTEAYTKPVKKKLQETQNSVQEMANENMDKLYGHYNQVVDTLQTTYKDAGKMYTDVRKKAGKALNKSMHTTQKQMGKAVTHLDETVALNRWKVIGAALVSGLFLGYWLKRAH